MGQVMGVGHGHYLAGSQLNPPRGKALAGGLVAQRASACIDGGARVRRCLLAARRA
jgi:hypothetical protein